MRCGVATIWTSLVLFSSPCAADEPGFARFLDTLGLPEHAAAEIERADRLGEPGPDADARADLGLRLVAQGQADAGLSLLEGALALAPDEAQADRRALVYGLALARAGRYPEAAQRLAHLQAFATTEDLRRSAGRSLCLVHLHAADARPAEACARAVLAGQAAQWSAELQTLTVDPDDRAWVGGVLSALVPGLGQLTAGQGWDGTGALLVNSAWGLGFAELLQAGAPTDATLLLVTVGLRFYAGNVQHGAQAWHRRTLARQKAAARLLMAPVAAAP